MTTTPLTLTPAQLSNAAIVASVAQSKGVNPYTFVADAFAESNLQNVPAYFDTNGPSVGLFSLHSTSGNLAAKATGGELAYVPGKNLAAQELAAQNPLVNATVAVANFQQKQAQGLTGGALALAAEGASPTSYSAQGGYATYVNTLQTQLQGSSAFAKILSAISGKTPQQVTGLASAGTLPGGAQTVIIPSAPPGSTSPTTPNAVTPSAAYAGTPAGTNPLLAILQAWNAGLNPQGIGLSLNPFTLFGLVSSTAGVLEIVVVRAAFAIMGLVVVAAGFFLLVRGGGAGGIIKLAGSAATLA